MLQLCIQRVAFVREFPAWLYSLIGCRQACRMREVTPGSATPAAADVRGDAGEPARAGLRVVWFAQLLPMAPGLQQRFLRQVFGGIAVARGAQADAQNERALRLSRRGRQRMFEDR